MNVSFVSICTLVLSLLTFGSAEAYLEINGYYNTDSFTNASTSSNNKMIYDLSLGFSIDKKGRYNLGWNYSSVSATELVSSVTTTYTSTQMGPRFVVFIDKNNKYSLGLSYNLVTSATFNDGTTSYTWKGTATKFDIGMNFPLGSSEVNLIGIRLNYASASYNEQLTNTTTYSQVSYSRALVYPSIYFWFGF